MSFIAFAYNEANALRIYEKTDTVSIISEQPSYGMCFTANDEVLLTDEDKRCINSLSRDGHTRKLFSTEWKPWGVCCIENDEIIVSFRYDGRLVKYSSTGEIRQTFDSTEFRFPETVAYNKVNRDIYVTEYEDKVKVIGCDGRCYRVSLPP